MALDVHLTRDINEKWGFELFGGADEEMPLTIVKVQVPSPASRAGLQNGDTIITINNEEAIDFTHEEGCRRVAECGHSLTVGVMRGLYDPVLDDQEPILYEPGDLDPESQPTEVPFKIQQFVEPVDLGSSIIDYSDTNNSLGTPFDPSVLLTESRSLTASPFVNPAKPYRPFSTEPMPEVPPLDDPIILNPDYKDEFGKGPNDINPDYVLNAYNKDDSFGSKFKLPISKQYDPDGKRKMQNAEIDCMLSKYTNMEMLSNKSIITDKNITRTTEKDANVIEYTEKILAEDDKSQKTISKNIKEENSKMILETSNKKENLKNEIKISDERETVTKDIDETVNTEELKHIEKIKKDTDAAQIEKTAITIVEDSIERAISITDEIKKEMEMERSSEIEQTASNIVCKTEQNLQTKQLTEFTDIKETDFEEIDKIASNKEHLQYVQENIHKQHINSKEQQISHNVYRKDKEQVSTLNLDSYEYKEIPTMKEFMTHDTKHSKTFENTTDIKKTTSTTGTKFDKPGPQQRTYEIGLQTIPNIKGLVHSSYHYDLLLRTFFFHLTDVMVALSRFLLTQPIFNTSETNKSVSESQMYDGSSTNNFRNTQYNEETKIRDMKLQEQKLEKRQLFTPILKQETRMESQETIKQVKEQKKMQSTSLVNKKEEESDVTQEHTKEEVAVVRQVGEKKVISGAQMAQRTERKLTKDMTKKMDAVISEFQNITTEEYMQDTLQRSRRSRSRSQIEEEVSKENDPLEWLNKVDSNRASQEISGEKLSKIEYSDSETTQKKKYEKLERQEIIHKKSKPPKQMYVAIVESHVYTNKDVIFEDVAELSETSSVQSAEEVNTAFESREAAQTEKVMLENAVQQIEKAKIVEELQEVSQVEKVVHESQSVKQEEYKKEIALQTSDVQEVLIQETKNTIQPMVENKETMIKENILVDKNESFSVTESSEIHTHESKSDFTGIATKQEFLSIVEEENTKSIANIRESERKVQIAEIITAKTDVASDIQIEEVAEKVVIKADKPNIRKGDEYAALKIVKEIEKESNSAKEIIEIEEVEVNKIKMSKDLQLDKSVAVTEKSAISSELGISMESQSKMSSGIGISSTSVENYKSESHMSESLVQESSFTAKSVDHKLTLRTDLKTQESIQSEPSTIDTPTPSTVPPTPLTDEYVFQLTIPLPKSRSTTPIPRDCTLSPEDEDPHIVKKKLIPHIETTIEKILYDPPLPTPPADKTVSSIFKTPGLFGGASKPIYKIKFPPIYRKPGLFGGADNAEFTQDEIREIERKSSLLASAIDQTIKSIEEYKEEVGIETKRKVKVVEIKEETTTNNYQDSYSKETIVESKQNGFEGSKTSIEEIIDTNDVVINNGHSENSVTVITDSQKLRMGTELFQKTNVVIDRETKQDKIPEKKSIENKRVIGITDTTHTAKEENETSVEIKGFSENSSIHETEISKEREVEKDFKKDPMLGFRSVEFDPEAIQKREYQHFLTKQSSNQELRASSPYITESGEIIGTKQGIVDGLEEPVMDPQLAKELGKPGISEEKIAELISGEAEMLREAHVMGLSRVLNSHMHRADDSSVDFQKIKPMINSLKDSEVLKALNEEMARQKEEQRKKEEKKWTTFLQKPKRPPPKAKFGYHGWTAAEQALVEEPYKVKIVKQAKPKVAPDYKPEDFDTGPLPWEQRAEIEAALPPAEPEEPILVPEIPEYLEAVDPLKESEVPDLEDTGLPLPPPKEPTPPPVIEQIAEEEPLIEQEPEVEEVKEVIEEVKETREDMENRLAEQLVRSVQSMVDPNAPVEQQLCQMRAQLAALAQLPEVIQQTLELVSKQLSRMGHQETRVEVSASQAESNTHHELEVTESQNQNGELSENLQIQNVTNNEQQAIIEEMEEKMESGDQLGEMVQQQQQCMRVQTPQITEEDLKAEKIQKEQYQKKKLEADARQIKQRPTPRVGKPTRMFGPPDPDSRPVVLPGGRRWRKTSDVYNEQMIAETLQAQAELIQGKTLGINFMKYEKPPVSLDHLQRSETYKLVHDMDQTPLKKVEMLKPVIAEADYRERCRSTTPSGAINHMQIPQQLHP